jgi:hypothetical protein
MNKVLRVIVDVPCLAPPERRHVDGATDDTAAAEKQRDDRVLVCLRYSLARLHEVGANQNIVLQNSHMAFVGNVG